MLKKIALMTLVLGLLCAAPAWAGNLSVSRTEVDFGSMTEGPVAEKAITLTNTGKEVVTIENVTTS